MLWHYNFQEWIPFLDPWEIRVDTLPRKLGEIYLEESHFYVLVKRAAAIWAGFVF